MQFDGAGQKVPIGAAARYLAQQIDIAQRGGQGEIQTRRQCLATPAKRQSGRNPTQVWLMIRQSCHQLVQVGRRALIDDVEILRETGRPRGDGHRATHNDELYFVPAQGGELLL